MNNRLLIDESPLQVLPTLAVEIGLNEAMFLQQLHFWLGVARRGRTGRRHEGKVWSYKTFEEWQQENFPFWSVSTIKRLVDKLVKSGLILAEKLDSHKRIQTNFYTINYAALKQICDGLEDEKCSVSECDNGECQNDTMEQLKMTRPIVSECDDVYVSTENTTETTTENKKTNKKDDADASGVCLESGSDGDGSGYEQTKIKGAISAHCRSMGVNATTNSPKLDLLIASGATMTHFVEAVEIAKQRQRPTWPYVLGIVENLLRDIAQSLSSPVPKGKSGGKFDPSAHVNQNRISRINSEGASDADFIDIQ